MRKPLDGIRIVEWGIYYAGPGASAILTDMGAEVIKIEQRGVGDPFRVSDSAILEIAGHEELIFLAGNRGKKSITIDMMRPEGREIVYRLVEKSDVFFTNVRRSTIEKFGMTYPALSKINPKVIYASVTAYGKQGPDANKGGFDTHGQARAGLMYSGKADSIPASVKNGIVDHSTAILASYQIVIALFMRERFGIGQEVDVSLLGSAFYLNYLDYLHTALANRGLPDNGETYQGLNSEYKCKDGKWLLQRLRARDFPEECQKLGYPELASDPRFNTAEGLSTNAGQLAQILGKIFATRNRDEWLQLFREGNVFMCAVNTPKEAFVDPQVIANDYVVPFEHPTLGRIMVPAFPIHFNGVHLNGDLKAPEIGEHTDHVLRDIGGYNADEIARFRNNKVV